MRRYHVVLFLAAAAATLAGAPTAGASPVEDAWPFGDFQLPGFSSGGTLTSNGLFDTGVLPWTDAGGDYSTHFDGIQAAFLGYLIHQEVFDSANPAAPDGTTWDCLSLTGFSNTVIVAPGIGVGDQIMFGSATNAFIIDAAGVHDLVSVSGYPPVTLFDIPMDLSALLDA